jgi:hypothetical protein
MTDEINIVHIIDAYTLEPLRFINLGDIDDVCEMKISADGQRMFVSTAIEDGGKISSHGLYTADQVDSPPFSEIIDHLAISPHGRHLVAGCYSGQLFLVEASSLNNILEVLLTSRLEFMECIEYLPSGRQVVAIAKDCAHLVDADSMVPLRTVDFAYPFMSCVACRNDRGEDCWTCLLEWNKVGCLRFASLVAMDEVDLVHVIPFDILCLAYTWKHLALSGTQGYICLLDYPSLFNNPLLQISSQIKLPLGDPGHIIHDLVFVMRSCTLAVAVQFMGVFVLDATHLTILCHSGNLWACLEVARPWEPCVPPPPHGEQIISMVVHAEPPAVFDECTPALHDEYRSTDTIEEMLSRSVQADMPGRGSNMAIKASQLISGQEQALILVQFHRCPKELLTALRTSLALKRCREALEVAGHSFERPNGDMVFVSPSEFDAANRAQANKSYNKFCVILTESNEHLVDEAIASVSHGVRIKSRVLVHSAFVSSACANMGSANSSNSSDQHATPTARVVIHGLNKQPNGIREGRVEQGGQRDGQEASGESRDEGEDGDEDTGAEDYEEHEENEVHDSSSSCSSCSSSRSEWNAEAQRLVDHFHCPQLHAMVVRTGDVQYECDVCIVHEDINTEKWFADCRKCDYSVCHRCLLKIQDSRDCERWKWVKKHESGRRWLKKGCALLPAARYPRRTLNTFSRRSGIRVGEAGCSRSPVWQNSTTSL